MQEEATKGEVAKDVKPLLEISSQELDAFIKRATERLENKIQDLAQEKKGLEGKVFERTKEIEKRMEEIDDSRKALMNILEDVEETRLEAVKERDKTVSIIDHFIDGIMVVDRDNNLELVNPAAEKFFEIKNEDLKGKNIASLKKNPDFSKIIDLLLDGDKIKDLERAEFPLRQDFTIEVATISLSEGEKNFGYLISFHDITREKMVERLKTEFVSVAAHQLRTPLSAIRWSISLLQEENISEADKKDLLDKCAQSNDRMINLVNDLLNVSRMEEGRYVYDFEIKDVFAIVDQSIAVAREEAKKKNLEFQYIIPKEKVPSLKLDEEKISLVFQNLAENALHYTTTGGKILYKIDYDKNKEELLFTVKDTGVGIPKNQQQRIFTKFFRADNVMRMETEGSGLGLFITKNIIEAHGGKIWFESEEGNGTTFYFTLPAKEEKI